MSRNATPQAEARWKAWKNNRGTQSKYQPQLEWEAHICEYVNFVAECTRSSKGPQALRVDIPFLGPHFVPPTFIHSQKRLVTPDITPDITYLKPLNVVHPFYYPELARCLQCDSDKIHWNGWTPTGHREVHGVSCEETAIGVQLRCSLCQAKYGKDGEEEGKGKYCWATTNVLFWERKEHWELPSTCSSSCAPRRLSRTHWAQSDGAPIFLKRCALTSELFNLVVELRPSTTAAGLSENFKRKLYHQCLGPSDHTLLICSRLPTELHLLEYHKQKLAYLKSFQARSQQVSVLKVALRTFAKPESSGKNLTGYDGTSITDDLITDVFAKFSEQTRQKESEESMRTKSGKSRPFTEVVPRASRDRVHRRLPFLVIHANASLLTLQLSPSLLTLPSGLLRRRQWSTLTRLVQDSLLVACIR